MLIDPCTTSPSRASLLERWVNTSKETHVAVTFVGPPGSGLDHLTRTFATLTETSNATKNIDVTVAPLTALECVEALGVHGESLDEDIIDRLRWAPELLTPLIPLPDWATRSFSAHRFEELFSSLDERLRSWWGQQPAASQLALVIAGFGPPELPLERGRALWSDRELDAMFAGGAAQATRDTLQLNPFARRVARSQRTSALLSTAIERLGELLFANASGWPDVFSSTRGEIIHLRSFAPFVSAMLDIPLDDLTERAKHHIFLACSASLVISLHQGRDAMRLERVDELIASMRMTPSAKHVLAVTLLDRANMYREDDPRCDHCLDEAHQLAIELGDDVLLEHARYKRAVQALGLLDRERGRQEMLDIITRDVTPALSVMARWWLIEIADDRDDLERTVREGLRASKQIEGPMPEIRMRTSAAKLARQQQQLELARHHLDRAVSLYAARPFSPFKIVIDQERALTERGLGNTANAIELLEPYLIERGERGMQLWTGSLLIDLADMYREEGQFQRALESIEIVEERGIRLDYPPFERTARLDKARILLEWARAVRPEGDHDDAARRELERALEPQRAREHAELGLEESRFRRALAELQTMLSRPHRHRVARDGSWFTLPNGARVTLEGKPTCMRTLGVLANAPSHALSPDALISQVWPDEQLTYSSGRNRLRVTLSTLRKLGMGDALQFNKQDQRYELSADLIGDAT